MKQLASVSLKFGRTWLARLGHRPCGYATQAGGSTTYLDVNIDASDGVATIAMNKPPVNSLNLEMLQDISNTIKSLESSKSCRGIILTSAIPNIFSAGLDIMEVYQLKEDRFKQFWFSLQQMWMDLYLCKLITMAAITGHSPGGGCLLAISCDYRIMVNAKYKIGLNETALGLVASGWFQDLFQKTIGHREGEFSLNLGKLYPAEEALQKGLVDKLSGSSEDAIKEAKEEMKKWVKLPTLARQATKLQLRQDAVHQLSKVREKEIEEEYEFMKKDTTQKSLSLYLEALKRKR